MPADGVLGIYDSSTLPAIYSGGVIVRHVKLWRANIAITPTSREDRAGQPGLPLESAVLAALTGWGSKKTVAERPPEPKALESVLAELKRREEQ